MTKKITTILTELVGVIPDSAQSATERPEVRAKEIARKTAMKAAAFSSVLAIPPGPLGIVTVIPDLFGIWRFQRQMVADIAAAYDATAELRTETMVYCLFKHGCAALTRDLVVRTGERLLIRTASVKSMQTILSRIGFTISERVVSESLARFVPFVGAVGLGAYAYYDTTKVGQTAMELFASSGECLPPLLEKI